MSTSYVALLREKTNFKGNKIVIVKICLTIIPLFVCCIVEGKNSSKEQNTIHKQHIITVDNTTQTTGVVLNTKYQDINNYNTSNVDEIVNHSSFLNITESYDISNNSLDLSERREKDSETINKVQNLDNINLHIEYGSDKGKQKLIQNDENYEKPNSFSIKEAQSAQNSRNSSQQTDKKPLITSLTSLKLVANKTTFKAGLETTNLNTLIKNKMSVEIPDLNTDQKQLTIIPQTLLNDNQFAFETTTTTIKPQTSVLSSSRLMQLPINQNLDLLINNKRNISKNFNQSFKQKRFIINNDEISEEQITCSHRPTIFGIRCDDEHVLSDNGAIVVKSDQKANVKLFGVNFHENMSFALTAHTGEPQDDCTNTDRVKSLDVTSITSHVAEVTVLMPGSDKLQPFYFCIQNNKSSRDWYHQGSSSTVKIFVQTDLLPLYIKLFIIAFLLGLSGLFSGLNLGLMSLDKNELQVIISSGTETEKRYAKAIEPVRRRGNYLLCSILFSNTLVNSTIAVLLESLTSGIVAIMTSTIFIVMFGEILPQAFCSRHGLAVGAKTVYLTYLCMFLTYPLSRPISYCLDWALGEEIGHVYDRERLMEFIRITQDYTNLKAEEVNIISGALKLKRVTIAEIMTKIEDVYMLELTSCLDFDTIQAIIEKGYSRIPVYEPGNRKNIVAVLFAKDLALIDPDDKTPVQTMISFYYHPRMYVFEDTTLDLALNEFKTGRSHMAIVQRVLDDGDKDPIYETTGIVTLEDVIEEIMQMEINDETDTLSDNRRKRRRKEAQVRKDFSEFTNLGAGDSSFNVATPQLCLAAFQYLATTVEPFSAKYLSDSILKRLLSQKIYYKVRVDDNQTQRRLYTAGEPADYFIMILEGRVHVVCGKENLVFDSGPFSFFGKAALTAGDASLTLNESASGVQSRKESSVVKPPMTRRESVVDKMGSQFSISMKKLEQLVLNEQIDASNTVNIPMTSVSTTIPSSSISWLKPGDSKTSVYSINYADKLASHYIPDYTVEIVSNTSYLKVSRSDYLTALKATLLERGNVDTDYATTSASSTANIDLDASQQTTNQQAPNSNQNAQQHEHEREDLQLSDSTSQDYSKTD